MNYLLLIIVFEPGNFYKNPLVDIVSSIPIKKQIHCYIINLKKFWVTACPNIPMYFT